MRTLEDWLDFQQRQHVRSIDLGLARVREVAGRLGLLALACPVVLVAGTNGNGSTVAHCAQFARAAGLRTPRWRQRLLEGLRASADAQGRVALGFEVVYGHAFKAAPRLRVAAETSVAVEDLRAMARRGSGKGPAGRG